MTSTATLERPDTVAQPVVQQAEEILVQSWPTGSFVRRPRLSQLLREADQRGIQQIRQTSVRLLGHTTLPDGLVVGLYGMCAMAAAAFVLSGIVPECNYHAWELLAQGCEGFRAALVRPPGPRGDHPRIDLSSAVIYLNDTAGWSFAQIADWAASEGF